MIYDFHILVGLPGSGKSYWSRHGFVNDEYPINLRHEVRNIEYHVLDIDKYVEEYGQYGLKSSIINLLKEEKVEKLTNYWNRKVSQRCICVDGLILTDEAICLAIDSCVNYVKTHVRQQELEKINIILHFWQPNRENCLHNDKMRLTGGEREKTARITIENTTILGLNHDWVQEAITSRTKEDPKISYKFKMHVVEKHSFYDIHFQPYVDNGSLFMKSDTWSGGGERGHCWDSTKFPIAAESPASFYQLDEFLEKICPNITHLQYKKLWDRCVTEQEDNDYDYYGGSEIRRWYEFNLEEGYQTLSEMGLIKEEE